MPKKSDLKLEHLGSVIMNGKKLYMQSKKRRITDAEKYNQIRGF